MTQAGYSGTPLVKKLGIKPGQSVYFLNTPDHYLDLLVDLPRDIVIGGDAPYDFIHAFTRRQTDLFAALPHLKHLMKKDGMLWVSWPKKASKLATDLDGNIVREFGLKSGLVDVKVAAIDEDWSGLKFVYRVEDR